MFFMPGTKMLFGDAKTTCDGKSDIYVSVQGAMLISFAQRLNELWTRNRRQLCLSRFTDASLIALKSAANPDLSNTGHSMP